MNADSVRIDVTDNTIDFRFYKEAWENEVLVKEERLVVVSVPKGSNHENRSDLFGRRR
jgi:hypothetical protein